VSAQTRKSNKKRNKLFLLEKFFGGCMEFPEAELIRKTIVLRKLDLPPSVLLTKRSLLRWLALSFGLISERESRTMLLEIIDALFYFLLKKNINPSSADIKKYLETERHISISERLVRYHLNKLIKLGVIARKNTRYYINPAPNAEREDLAASTKFYIKKELEEWYEQIEKALNKLTELHRK